MIIFGPFSILFWKIDKAVNPILPLNTDSHLLYANKNAHSSRTYSHSIIQLYFWKINRLILPLHHAGNQRMPPLHRVAQEILTLICYHVSLKETIKKWISNEWAPLLPSVIHIFPRTPAPSLGLYEFFFIKCPDFCGTNSVLSIFRNIPFFISHKRKKTQHLSVRCWVLNCSLIIIWA